MDDSINNFRPRFGSAAHAMGFGAVRFAIVSVVAFGIWAFGARMGVAVVYTSIALAFAGLSGLLLHPLIEGANRLSRFYAIFVPGFLCYSALWCVGWFGIEGHVGEVFGSAAGLAVFTLILCRLLKSRGAYLEILAVLFLCYTLGYYLGDRLYSNGHGPELLNSLYEAAGAKMRVTVSRLLWGAAYGAGFGAGLGYAFYKCQAKGSPSEQV